jgi:hypothetical protein
MWQTGDHQLTKCERNEANSMLKKRFSKLNDAFDADHVNFWSQLSRLNNLMVIVNISMFFLTGLVIIFSPSIRWRVQVSWGWALSSQQPLSGTYGIIGLS